MDNGRAFAFTILVALLALWGQSATAQSTFQDCPICPMMVHIPGATVELGTNTSARPEEGPAYQVTLEPFAISAFEITQAQWLDHKEDWRQETERQRDADFTRFTVLVEGCFMWELDQSPARLRQKDLVIRAWDKTPDHPIGCIAHADAMEYVDWLNRKTDGGYRLPTEAELEYLLRLQPLAPDLTQSCDQFNGALADKDFPHDGGPCPAGETLIAPVGRTQPNRLGVSDLYGNLWELTHNCWTGRADAPETHGQYLPRCAGSTVVVRGGSFDDPAENFRPSIRQPVPITRRQQNIGFRVVKMN